jgi:hypothetical protein
MRFFEFKSAREQNVVLEMNVLVEITLEISETVVQRLEAHAGACRRLKIIGQGAETSQ